MQLRPTYLKAKKLVNIPYPREANPVQNTMPSSPYPALRVHSLAYS